MDPGEPITGGLPPGRRNGRGLLVFALLITSGLTFVLGRPARSQKEAVELEPVVISLEHADPAVSRDTLHRGEALSQVLSRQRLTANEAAAVVGALRPHVNLRSLRAGVTLDFERSVSDSLLGIDIRVDSDRLVKLRLDVDGWSSDVTELAVTVDTVVLAGLIESTLYQSVMDLAAPGIGAQERIERLMWGIYKPFQWAIDFGLDVREGDRYRAVYERHVREDGSVKSGRILASEFTNRGVVHRAFWYEPRGEYFDDDGASMRRFFLKAPLDFRRISSRFTRRRLHPKLGVYRAHLGTDYAAARGTQVFAAADGTITRAGTWGGYGRIVEIRHANGYRTRYAHLNGFARGVRTGVKTRQGQVIGYVGSSGLATGAHLHYEMWQKGKAVDPRTINFPSGNPVSEGEMTEFRRSRDRLRALLSRANEPTLPLAE